MTAVAPPRPLRSHAGADHVRPRRVVDPRRNREHRPPRVVIQGSGLPEDGMRRGVFRCPRGLDASAEGLLPRRAAGISNQRRQTGDRDDWSHDSLVRAHASGASSARLALRPSRSCGPGRSLRSGGAGLATGPAGPAGPAGPCGPAAPVSPVSPSGPRALRARQVPVVLLDPRALPVQLGLAVLPHSNPADCDGSCKRP